MLVLLFVCKRPQTQRKTQTALLHDDKTGETAEPCDRWLATYIHRHPYRETLTVLLLLHLPTSFAGLGFRSFFSRKLSATTTTAAAARSACGSGTRLSASAAVTAYAESVFPRFESSYLSPLTLSLSFPGKSGGKSKLASLCSAFSLSPSLSSRCIDLFSGKKKQPQQRRSNNIKQETCSYWYCCCCCCASLCQLQFRVYRVYSGRVLELDSNSSSSSSTRQVG